MELRKAYVELLRNFDIHMVNPGTRAWLLRSYAIIVIEDFDIRVGEDELDEKSQG